MMNLKEHKKLRDDLKKAFDEHYGLSSEHPGQFLTEDGEWDDLPDFTKLELVPASHADLLVLRDLGDRMRVMDEDELAQRRAEAIRWSHSETLPLLMHGR
jgi:hypothetical protein